MSRDMITGDRDSSSANEQQRGWRGAQWGRSTEANGQLKRKPEASCSPSSYWTEQRTLHTGSQGWHFCLAVQSWPWEGGQPLPLSAHRWLRLGPGWAQLRL